MEMDRRSFERLEEALRIDRLGTKYFFQSPLTWKLCQLLTFGR